MLVKITLSTLLFQSVSILKQRINVLANTCAYACTVPTGGMPSSSRSILAIFLVTLLVLAGCVSGGPIESPTESPVEEATTAGATQTAVEGTVEVHFINVGQSVSTLVVGPTGETMLVDTGHFTDDGEYVLQYLQAHGIERLDHLVVSHNDADHIGGNAAIIDYYETEADGIGAIYDPGIAASTQTYSEYLDAVEDTV